ncbi:MAG TPA: SusC/RagA family TonB-linked outer membrane protein, partial [Bacteroidales bacterium]|nr:SusC/RagA family TonB-linked outer membrane protein [Bacteroidales bacterium]
MKLTSFLLIMTVFQLWATETYSQLTKLSLHLENTRIADALKEIEDQSEFYFLYSPKLVDVEKRVNIVAEQETIKDILTDVFGEDVKFAVHDRQIILMPKDKSEIIDKLQQQNVVTGKVIDSETGEPIPGVNIIVKGTTVGTM